MKVLRAAALAIAANACSPTPAPVPPPPPSSTASASASAGPVAPPPRVIAPPPPMLKPPFKLADLLDVERSVGVSALADDRFVYLSDRSGTMQVNVGDIPPKLARATTSGLTALADRVAAVRASPTGKEAVFLSDAGGDENYQIHAVAIGAPAKPTRGRPAAPPAPVKLTDAPKVRHSSPVFSEKGDRLAFTSNRRNGKDMDLYVDAYPPKGGAKLGEKPLLELSGSHTAADLRGAQALVVEERSNVDQNLWLVDVKAKKKELLTQHAGDERWGHATFSTDGKRAFAATDAGRDFVGVVQIDLATKKRRELVRESWDVSELAVCPAPKDKATPKGATDVVAWALNERGKESLFVAFVDAKGDELVRKQVALAGVFSSLSCAPSGRFLYATVEASTHAPEVFRVEVATAAAQQVSDGVHLGIDEKDLVKEELLALDASDGVPLSFFWYAKPRADGARIPVVVDVHGGPEAQAQPGWSPFVQYLAASGWGVARPNVRGSTGYGKAFTHLDDKAKREDSVRDLAEIGKLIAGRSDVDPDRVAVYGGSYGGYMVLASLTLYPKQWAAGVDIVGIANFRSFLERTAPYRRALREAEYGSLSEDGALLDRLSPLGKVDRIEAPLLVIHGANDPRVPLFEAQQVAKALEERKRPVDLLVFDDEGHGLAKKKNRLVAFPKIVSFLEEHVVRRK